MWLHLLFLPMAYALIGGSYDYNGFRYQLANPSVDVDQIDFSGDDCADYPCPYFAVPAGCSSSFYIPDGVAQAKMWGTSFLVTPYGFSSPASWLQSPGSFSIVDTVSNPGSVALTTAGWEARILLQCNIPCAAGSYVTGSLCLPCGVGKWSEAGAKACQACTNAPINSNYTSSGSGSSNCLFTCAAGSFGQPNPMPYLLIGDQLSVRAVDGTTDMVTTVYKPNTYDPTYLSSFMVASSVNPQILYMGRCSINKVNLTTGKFTVVAGSSSSRGMQDGVGTAAVFNSIVAAVLWQNENYLLALDGANCNLRVVNLATAAVTTALGGACGFQDGLAGLLLRPNSIILNAAQTTAYIADSGNYRVRAVTLATMEIRTVVGNGVASNIDGTGIYSSVIPRHLALNTDETVLYVKSDSSLRQITLSTSQLSTVAPSLGPSPYQLAVSKLDPNIIYYSTSFSVATLVVSANQAFPIAGSAAPSATDGKGIAAGFLAPTFMALINESLGTPLCVSCAVCPVGQLGFCNSTTSFCYACPAGYYTTMAGATACTQCAAGKYASQGKNCVTCPAGSYSAQGATTCSNCSAGTFSPGNTASCLNCSGGTYSASGASTCSQCANVTGNATFSSLPGTNATNCPFACNSGYNYAPAANLCSICAVGQWSATGATVCSTCAQLANATFTGVGTNASNCPFMCNLGYVSNSTACVPCPAGTKALPGACAPCLPGSFSGPSRTTCTNCAPGYYSDAGASSCSVCANNGQYSVFVGRGTSSSCPFYCVAGAYVVNRTSCAPCVNGTYSSLGVTACTACSPGTWSNAASTACTACSSLEIIAFSGTGIIDSPYLSKAGWGMASVVCKP